jgi:hypothetical protein
MLLIHARLYATADREPHLEDISAGMLSRRDIPMPEKIEVTRSI